MTDLEKLKVVLKLTRRLQSLRKRVMEEVCPTSTASRGTLERAVADLIHGIGGPAVTVDDCLGQVIAGLESGG